MLVGHYTILVDESGIVRLPGNISARIHKKQTCYVLEESKGVLKFCFENPADDFKDEELEIMVQSIVEPDKLSIPSQFIPDYIGECELLGLGNGLELRNEKRSSFNDIDFIQTDERTGKTIQELMDELEV